MEQKGEAKHRMAGSSPAFPQLLRQRKLLLKRLRHDTVKEDIEKEFGWFGEIEYIKYRNGHDRALVCYCSPQHAYSALKFFQTGKFKNGLITVHWAFSTKSQMPISNDDNSVVFSQKLDDLASGEKEIRAVLKKSWEDHVKTVSPSQECLTFEEIVKCLEKIPYEMAQDPMTNEFFQEEMDKLKAAQTPASVTE